MITPNLVPLTRWPKPGTTVYMTEEGHIRFNRGAGNPPGIPGEFVGCVNTSGPQWNRVNWSNGMSNSYDRPHYLAVVVEEADDGNL